jgi:AMP-polyphosphate phosphotransferase
MLEKIDLDKKISKKEYETLMEDLAPKLARLQRDCKTAQIPIMVVFEGWGAAGKGTLINRLIGPLDPRGFKVYTIQKASEEEAMRPFLWRFWTKTPANGRIHIFDRSWYRRIFEDHMEGKKYERNNQKVFEEIVHFEQELAVEGMLIIKFFLHISKKEQKKRFESLEKSKNTAWRVMASDWRQNKDYQTYLQIFDDMMAKTDTDHGKWTIVEASNKEYATAKIIKTVVERMEEALIEKEVRKELPEKLKKPQSKKVVTVENPELNKIEKSLKLDVLSSVDLSLKIEKEEYKKRLKELQEKLALLHFEMYKHRIPVVLAFEGWDAGGKGGAIKRLTENMDPRGYEVIPVAAPNDMERSHHYLWRFWNAMPKAGHMTIFDRTWYGRVMVERIEGFCKEADWKRAFNELNHMEEHLTNFGCIVIKFWMHIDQDEQAARFKERQETPDKQWKITEEDWRNREKWKEYEEAVNEMIIRTSTNHAPWIIVEANDKYYARIKVLETVVNALEARMETMKKKSR